MTKLPADFHVWGRVEHIAPHRFFVIVTSVRADDPAIAHSVNGMAGSREGANDLRRKLMLEVGAAIAGRGDRVTDVEADD